MKRQHLEPWCSLLLAGAMLVPTAEATFSITACEAESGHCGVAIATNNLAVGHGVPFAVAGIGAGVSQFETNPCQAPAALRALHAGKSAQVALDAALDATEDCADGYTVEHRQTAVVAMAGSTAAHTGKQAGTFAGERRGERVVVAGNGLVGGQVLDAMWHRYRTSSGPLAERLLLVGRLVKKMTLSE